MKIGKQLLAVASALFLSCLFQPAVLGQARATPTINTESGESSITRVFALRLKPGQDLRAELEKFAKAKQLRAGFVITTVGSLTQATLRLADQPSSTRFEGKFEIVSLVGTFSQDGVHLHISLSDSSDEQSVDILSKDV